MQQTNHIINYRKDYQPSPFTITDVRLEFQLFDTSTRVKSTTTVCVNPLSTKKSDTLILHGEELKLLAISIDDRPLTASDYHKTEKGLEIYHVPEQFNLCIETEIDPDGNTSLEGLYRSSGNYCTQCEAEGFRKITYYLDRPDVMAKFTTRIEGNKKNCPVMLSNGNLIDQGEIDEDRHFVVWEDPFPKPSYLFALVAGQIVSIDDTYTTATKRQVHLRIFVEERNRHYCRHAMESLKKSMKWDEDVFGLSYDLDTYMVVAVDDFNMGAMENKGLNIFNSKYVLASEQTATDQDYLAIEGVIAHEYFHNWTGNRVTCRDWFQLSLKEGLTVFRDQEFSSDMNSRAVQRIDDVKVLRDYQFREDAGPMAHSVRPDSYVEINNFYTVTVYNKGAEVIRMIHTLLGAENFRKGMDLYFARHDGQAVTCDDFVAAMADASGVNLEQFKRWYSQAGTPVVTVQERWDEMSQTYHLVLSQTCAATPGQEHKEPFQIPLRMGGLNSKGEEIIKEQVLQLTAERQEFTFNHITESPVLSFNRGFSAPVIVNFDQTSKHLAFLMAHDKDLFNRWESANKLASQEILAAMECLNREKTYRINPLFLDAIRVNLEDQQGDKSLVAQAITLPSEMYIAQHLEEIEPQLLNRARNEVIAQISRHLHRLLHETYHANEEQGAYQITNEAIGRRRLKNCCLQYLMALAPITDDTLELCHRQYVNSQNMTDKIAALKELANLDHSPHRKEALDDFYNLWQHDPLVMDKWFSLQAVSKRKNCMKDVLTLMNNPRFSMDNPNKVRALIGAFCSNHARFHSPTGEGYQFLGDQIIKLNPINPQIAARLLTPLTMWKRYHQAYRDRMREQLERISATRDISSDVYEIVEKSL